MIQNCKLYKPSNPVIGEYETVRDEKGKYIKVKIQAIGVRLRYPLISGDVYIDLHKWYCIAKYRGELINVKLLKDPIWD